MQDLGKSRVLSRALPAAGSGFRAKGFAPLAAAVAFRFFKIAAA